METKKYLKSTLEIKDPSRNPINFPQNLNLKSPISQTSRKISHFSFNEVAMFETDDQKSESCNQHNMLFTEYCIDCDLKICSKCLISQEHTNHELISNKYPLKTPKKPPQSCGLETFLSHIKTHRKEIKEKIEERIKIDAIIARNNFEKLIKEAEKTRDKVIAKTLAYYKKIETAYETWMKNMTDQVFSLKISRERSENLFDFNLEVRRFRSEFDEIKKGLEDINVFTFAFDGCVLEGVSRFCSARLKETHFLKEFRMIRELNLFQMDVEDPFLKQNKQENIQKSRNLKNSLNPQRRSSVIEPENNNHWENNQKLASQDKNSTTNRLNLRKTFSMPEVFNLIRPNFPKQRTSVERQTISPSSLSNQRVPSEKRRTLMLSAVQNEYSNDLKKSLGEKSAETHSKNKLNLNSLATKINNSRNTSVSKLNSEKETMFQLPLLDMSDKQFSEKEFLKFFSALKINGRIQVLDLSKNSLTDENLRKILQSLTEFYIQTIILDCNYLTEEALDHFASFKNQNYSVENFSVRGNVEINKNSVIVKQKLFLLEKICLKVFV